MTGSASPSSRAKRDEHVDAGVAQRGERARRAAELRGQARAAHGVQALGGLVEAHEPAGRLQAEGDRHGLLQQRPPGHHRRAVLAGQPRRRLGRAAQVVEQRLERAPRDEHRRAVEDVLARRAAVHVGGRRVADLARAARARAAPPGLPTAAASAPSASTS